MADAGLASWPRGYAKREHARVAEGAERLAISVSTIWLMKARSRPRQRIP